ncbi:MULTISPECIES: aspartate/glutamate racemase family protein [Actinomadura]|uniref:aspartate/glutamate racemase family protein n=1 Tax=Actinomadura TaxID=1988 RepID=UPI0004206409|nr:MULTISPECIES: aspartate/glutamate racemase family protein [Actinomadura]RSN70853.1 hydantoin racemase [Actinomadura sp. WAC 06369]
MRALAVTPIHLPPDEVRRRQARYDRLAPPGLTVELRDVGPAAPPSLEDEAAVRASESAVAAALAEAGDGFDLAFPDCVLDPAVPDGAAAPGGGVPVNGLLKLSSMHLSALNVRFGAVVRNEAIAAELDRRLRAYGLAGNLAGIAILALPFDAIADTAAWNAALGDAVAVLAEAGATAVINGCSAVDVEDAALAAAVVDPTALALRLLVARAEADAAVTGKKDA